MLPTEFHALVKREHCRDYVTTSEQDSIAARLQPAQPPRAPMRQRLRFRLARHVAVPLGRVLLRLSVRLLRFAVALEMNG